MKIPIILGIPITIWGGMLVLILIIFQVLNGMKIIKVPIRCHKGTALAILALGILHAIGGLGITLGWFS